MAIIHCIMQSFVEIPKKLLMILIRVYQRTLSFDHGIVGKMFPGMRFCRYTPTCSQYGYEAVNKHGAIKGSILATKRVLRCHPWAKHDHFDPVP